MKGITISQRKCALDISNKTSKLNCKHEDTCTNPNVKLVPRCRDLLENPSRQQKLVVKLNYLTIT